MPTYITLAGAAAILWLTVRAVAPARRSGAALVLDHLATVVSVACFLSVAVAIAQ